MSAWPVLVEQGVPPGEQHAVDVGLAHEPGWDRALVHPDADGSDDALVAPVGEHGVGLADRLVGVVVRVVDEHHVDPVEAESLQRLRQ